MIAPSETLKFYSLNTINIILNDLFKIIADPYDAQVFI